ncbi:MAG: MFS transporter [Acidimicrobiia bacterium]
MPGTGSTGDIQGQSGHVTARQRVFIILSFGFVLLGMGVTVPSVTWPSIAADFDRSLAELGFITFLYGGGYTVSTLVSGRLTARVGIAKSLIAAGITASLALTAMAVSPSWWPFLAATALLGIGGGLTDAATNTYVAIRRGARSMGLIHGMFGIGAIAGPLFVTGLLHVGVSWRVAYAALAIGQLAYAAGLWQFARNVDVPREPGAQTDHASLRRSPMLFWSLAVFFAYAGIAAGAGVWAFTFLTAERGVSDGVSGLIVAAYWGGLTASRLLLGLIGDRFPPETMLRWASTATIAGFLVFWWSPTSAVGAAALVFTGFAHGPVFPLEMLLTPRRFGTGLTATVVGFEIAAANVGGALLPGLFGVAVSQTSLSIIPPLLFVNAVVLWFAIEILNRKSAERRPQTQDNTSGTSE